MSKINRYISSDGRKQSVDCVTEKNTGFDKVVHEVKHTAMGIYFVLKIGLFAPV